MSVEITEEEKKKIIANELEILIIKMTNDFEKWRDECGTKGWHSIPSEWSKNFFTRYIVQAAKIGKRL